jgi:hypothetical protein
MKEWFEDFDLKRAKKFVLTGDTDHLWSAFIWSQTKKDDYWLDLTDKPKAGKKARKRVLNMIIEYVGSQ